MSKLRWTKNITGSRLDIWKDDELAGTIRWEGLLNKSARAILFGKSFILRRELIFSKVEIYDSDGQSLLGTITINPFTTRQDIVINGKRFELEIHNLWQSRWSWKFNGAEIISFSANPAITKDSGSIDMCTTCNNEVDILILLGLVVRNQFITFLLILILIILLIIL